MSLKIALITSDPARMTDCPFCKPKSESIFYEDELVRGLWDRFPISPGHALIIPKRHVETWFEASSEEHQALTQALTRVKAVIEAEHQPDSYNIGINSGKAAGQTIPHLHVHLIPRYQGDVPDPRGGVRNVIPTKANYWD